MWQFMHYNVNNLWLHTVCCIACFFKKQHATACTNRHMHICRKNGQSWIWNQHPQIKIGLIVTLAGTTTKTVCGWRIWLNLTPTIIRFAWRTSWKNTMFTNIWTAIEYQQYENCFNAMHSNFPEQCSYLEKQVWTIRA